MNHFNLLPPEIIEFIFNKLNLDDLINLRIVDKRFKQICEQIKIKQLYVSDYLYNEYHPLFWFYTNDPTYFKENVIEFVYEFSKFQNYATIFQFDKHLKRLALDIDYFNFSILNQFKLLEQLDVKTIKLNVNYKLSLDHLKIVDFELKDNSDFKLTLDTIKLFAFRFRNQLKRNVVFNYPDKILFFELGHYFDYDWSSLFDNHLKNFNNLQYLKINYPYASSLGKNILSQLKNLKILDLNIGYSLRVNEYDNLIEKVRFLINEKENLRRSEFEIYLNGFKLINQNKLNQPIQFNYNQLEFQIKNYDLLKDNCDTTEINYCDLIKLIKIIPSSFTNKFPFIRYVKANARIDNEDQFIKFLNNLTYLSELELINCGLTKSFYDQLINLVYLKDLVFLRIKEKNDLEINFDFILQLKKLEHFETNQIIANHIDLIYKLFRGNQNIYFYLFIFKFDSKNYIEINKYSEYNLVFYNLYDKYKGYGIRSYYLDDNLEEVENFTIDDLKYLDDVISKLKELKF